MASIALTGRSWAIRGRRAGRNDERIQVTQPITVERTAQALPEWGRVEARLSRSQADAIPTRPSLNPLSWSRGV